MRMRSLFKPPTTATILSPCPNIANAYPDSGHRQATLSIRAGISTWRPIVSVMVRVSLVDCGSLDTNLLQPLVSNRLKTRHNNSILYIMLLLKSFITILPSPHGINWVTRIPIQFGCTDGNHLSYLVVGI